MRDAASRHSLIQTLNVRFGLITVG